jgi:hypothetical protein
LYLDSRNLRYGDCFRSHEGLGGIGTLGARRYDLVSSKLGSEQALFFETAQFANVMRRVAIHHEASALDWEQTERFVDEKGSDVDLTCVACSIPPLD